MMKGPKPTPISKKPKNVDVATPKRSTPELRIAIA